MAFIPSPLAALVALLATTPAPPVAAGVAAVDLDLMSFNVRYGTAPDGMNAWSKRRTLVFDVIRRHDPDVVGVQEALRFQLDEIREAVPGYGEIGVGRDDGREAGEYAAILYRKDRFEVAGQGTFWLSETPAAPGSTSFGNRIPRITTWARFLDRESGCRVLVYNVHLDHESQPSREKSVALLLEKVAKERRPDDEVIVMGDFNAGERNPAIAAMKEAFVDSFRVAHPEETLVGTFGGFEGQRNGRKIDYVFVRPDARVVGAAIVHERVDDRDPSDHYPVTARLEVGGANPRFARRAKRGGASLRPRPFC